MANERERRLDAFLVASARLGDRRSFEMLVRRWNGKLTGHAWRLLGNEELARDAVQEGWLEIFRGLGRLRDEDVFAAWAYRIVSRRCARHVRRLQGERRLAAAMEAAPPPAELEADPALQDVQAAQRALRLLPAEQQAAVALFYLEDMSVAEVAVALDVPAGTVKTRLMHARRKMRGAFQGDE